MWGRELFHRGPRIVYSTHSPRSGEIKVWSAADSLALEVGGYPQSVSKDTPDVWERYWGIAAQEVARRRPHLKNLLLIGLGGGTLLHLLRQLLPTAAFTVVEIDEEVIKIARRFFAIDEIENLKVVPADGLDYLKHLPSGEKFDVVFVDAYLGGNFPLHFEEEDFLRTVKGALSQGGLAIFNRTSGRDLKNFQLQLPRVFAKVETRRIPLTGILGGEAGNYLLFCE